MKSVAEFLVFCVLAAFVHVGIVLLMDAEEEVLASAAGGGPPTALGASGDLAELIESWEQTPDHQTVIDQAEAPAQETTVEVPQDLAKVEAPDLAALDTAPTARPAPANRVDAPKAPDTRNVTQLPLPTPDPQPQYLDLVKLAPATSDAPAQPVPASPAATAPTIAEPFLQDPEETGPAPRVAALPKAKPEVPAWAKPQRRQPIKASKKTDRQPVRKQPRKQPAQAQATPKQDNASQPDQQGTAETPRQGDDGVQTVSRPGTTGSDRTGQGYSAGQVKDATAAYKRAVARAIAKKKRYPRKAHRRGVTGRAVIRLSLGASGELLSAALVKSSGSDTLDKAALAAARAARYPKIPKEMGRSRVNYTTGVDFVTN